MPLEIYIRQYDEDPNKPEEAKWRRIRTVYPADEVQIPNFTEEGKMELWRVQVKPNDTLSTAHKIFPHELVFKANEPAQVEYDPKESENRPIVIKKGEEREIFARWVLRRGNEKRVEEVVRFLLRHK